MTRIIVVDDHIMFRQGIVSLIKSVEDFEVISEASSGNEAVKLAHDICPNLILMDISLPDINGIEAAKMIKKNNINTEIILLTMHNDESLLEMALKVGIKGYILKNDAFDDLIYAIKTVIGGKKFISSSLYKDYGHISDLPISPSPLTTREKEIVILITDGLSSKEIAERLFISVKTVEKHRTNIMEKLGLKNMAELVKYAFKIGIIRL